MAFTNGGTISFHEDPIFMTPYGRAALRGGPRPRKSGLLIEKLLDSSLKTLITNQKLLTPILSIRETLVMFVTN